MTGFCGFAFACASRRGRRRSARSLGFLSRPLFTSPGHVGARRQAILKVGPDPVAAFVNQVCVCVRAHVSVPSESCRFWGAGARELVRAHIEPAAGLRV